MNTTKYLFEALPAILWYLRWPLAVIGLFGFFDWVLRYQMGVVLNGKERIQNGQHPGF